DTAAPASTVSFPADGGMYRTATWAGALSGTASDTGGAAVRTVELSLREGSGNWYGGTSFDEASQTFLAADGTTNWSHALGAAEPGRRGWSSALGAAKLPSGRPYTPPVRAAEGAGTVESEQTYSFLYDAIAPSSTATFPAAGAAYQTATWGSGFAGTASDVGG